MPLAWKQNKRVSYGQFTFQYRRTDEEDRFDPLAVIHSVDAFHWEPLHDILSSAHAE